MQTQDTLTSLCEKYCLGKMQGEALPAEGAAAPDVPCGHGPGGLCRKAA